MRINKTLACEHADDKVAIGLLDIYGFEIFQVRLTHPSTPLSPLPSSRSSRLSL